MNIYEKLQMARVTLQNKKLKKSGKNKFSGFEYFELSDFLPSINQIFSELKLFSRFLINEKQATLQIINVEKIDEEIIFTMPVAKLELKGCNEIQALGGINTYLRRYLYMNALEIVESDLFDSTTGKEEKKSTKIITKESSVVTEPNIDADLDIIEGLKEINDIENFKIYYKTNFEKVSDKKKFNEIATKIKKEIEKGQK